MVKKTHPFTQTCIKIKPQYLTFLIMLYVTISLAGNSVLFKIVKVGYLLGPGGILLVPLILLIEDVIAEVYGYKISRTLLWYILISELLFGALVLIIAHLPSPAYWHDQKAFDVVFGSLLKGTPTLVFAIFAGRFLNLYIITKLKILVKGKYFWLRSVFSSLCGDLVTLTIIFTVLFGEIPMGARVHLYLSDLSTRLVYSMVGGLIGILIVRYLKRKEGIDVYDYNTNFNPFSLQVDKENKLTK